MTDNKRVQAAIALFPAEFWLPTVSDHVYRIDPVGSYVRRGRVVLNVQAQRDSGEPWTDYCTAGVDELQSMPGMRSVR